MEPYNDDDKFKFTDLDNLEIENSIKYLDVTQEKKDKLRNLFIQFQGLKKQALDKCKNSKDGKEIHGFYYNIIEVGKEIPQWFYHHEIEEIIMTTFHYLKNLITPYINNIVL
ncbi:hypothetical protein RB653_007829 [Dictyostelium firmibasis]|uniref:Uncharacterized protein n=1 Tax=Dictyostelium firmibasis TaxID=79012 RepID=A0AAN7TX54_9MYCE